MSESLIPTSEVSDQANRDPTPKVTWQSRVLPVITFILVFLTVFFVIATFVQLLYIHWNIMQAPVLDVQQLFNASKDLQTQELPVSWQEQSRLIGLEVLVVQNRYHQARVMLLTGIWVRYLGFITGMILGFVGAFFVLSKLGESVAMSANTERNPKQLLFATTPGLVVAVLGTALMLATILKQQEYATTDASLYINPPVTATATPTVTPTAGSPLPDINFGDTESFDSATPAAP